MVSIQEWDEDKHVKTVLLKSHTLLQSKRKEKRKRTQQVQPSKFVFAPLLLWTCLIACATLKQTCKTNNIGLQNSDKWSKKAERKKVSLRIKNSGFKSFMLLILSQMCWILAQQRVQKCETELWVFILFYILFYTWNVLCIYIYVCMCVCVNIYIKQGVMVRLLSF